MKYLQNSYNGPLKTLPCGNRRIIKSIINYCEAPPCSMAYEKRTMIFTLSHMILQVVEIFRFSESEWYKRPFSSTEHSIYDVGIQIEIYSL